MKRSIACLAVVALLAGCGSVSRKKFDDVDRAGRDIQSAIATKADRERYAQLVRAYSSEVERARSSATSAPERTAIGRYAAVQSGLQDILLVWEAKDASQQELMPLSAPLASRVQKEYDLPVNTNEPPSIYASEALQMIWDATKKKMEALASE